MKKITLLLTALFACYSFSFAQEEEFPQQSCISIMVGKKASADGSVITSHTCDGRYRTWMSIEPAADYPKGAKMNIYKGTAHTVSRDDTTGVRLAGTIPQAAHTYAYLNTAYPSFNEKQLAIGETTFGGPDTLRNDDGMFLIEELERVALQRCTRARQAIHLIADLVKTYGYGDGGECITIADRQEVWQMEILGEGPDRIGGIWAAQRVPDDHVAVSANIPRIAALNRSDTNNFLCSDNIEAVALKYGLWDGKGEFVFWKAFNASFAEGRNFREREFHVFNTLAPSYRLTYDLPSLPFSVRPDSVVSVRQVMSLLRSTYEGSSMDMCQNIKMPVSRKQADGTVTTDTVISPIANPWMTNNMLKTLNYIAPGVVEFRRTVSVAWCSYSFVAQLRSDLPDAIGGICWVAVDNPGQSPHIPVFCGTTMLPPAFAFCGQKQYNPNALLWQFRKANKLATLAWQSTKKDFMDNLLNLEQQAFDGLSPLKVSVLSQLSSNSAEKVSTLLNNYTDQIYRSAVSTWEQMEAKYWHRFGMGF